METHVPIDTLSQLLERVQIDAQLFRHQDYCGHWTIDNSGSGLIPFHLIDKGQGWLHMEGESPQLLQAGDFVLFPRDFPHIIASEIVLSQSSEGNSELGENVDVNFASILCGFYSFRSSAANPLLNDLPAVVLIKDARRNSTIPSIRLIIDAALLELEHDYPGRSAALHDLARLLFLNVIRDRIIRGQSKHFLAALGDPQIGKALTMIHTQFGQNLSLEVLAQRAGMSRSAFSEKFHTLVGITPAKYLTNWRMQEAMMLLETTDLSVEQIAETCGYSSHVAFRKAFKATMEITPKQVRMGNRKKALLEQPSIA